MNYLRRVYRETDVRWIAVITLLAGGAACDFFGGWRFLAAFDVTLGAFLAGLLLGQSKRHTADQKCDLYLLGYRNGVRDGRDSNE